MSEICDKYGLTPDQFKNMVRDGVILPFVPSHDEIISSYKQALKGGKNKSDAIFEAAEKHKVSTRWVYKLIERI